MFFFAEKSFFSAMSSDAKSHLRLVTPPNNLTKAPLLNLDSYTPPTVNRRKYPLTERMSWHGLPSMRIIRLSPPMPIQRRNRSESSCDNLQGRAAGRTPAQGGILRLSPGAHGIAGYPIVLGHRAQEEGT